MKQILSEALYALPEGDVVARRQPIFKPFMAVVAGVALLIVDLLAVEDNSGALGMTLLVASSVLLIYGLVAVVMRLVGGERVPYNKAVGSYMCYRERYFDRELYTALCKAVERGDRAAIDAMPTTNISAIMLVEYSTRRGGIAAYSIYEYADNEHKLRFGPMVVRQV